MKTIVLILLVVLLFGCSTDKSPFSPIDDSWRALMIRNVERTEIFATVEVWDSIRNPFLTDIRGVDPNSDNIITPISWEYYYTRKDANVYLVVVSLKDFNKQLRYEGK